MGHLTNNNYIPHPEAVRLAKERINATMRLTFWLDINGWRTVWLHKTKVTNNNVKENMAVVYFEPVLVIGTPYMPAIGGEIAVSNMSLDTHRVTWLHDDKVEMVGFKPCNKESELWLKQKLALAAGMKFREHGFLDKEKIIYTKNA